MQIPAFDSRDASVREAAHKLVVALCAAVGPALLESPLLADVRELRRQQHRWVHGLRHFQLEVRLRLPRLPRQQLRALAPEELAHVVLEHMAARGRALGGAVAHCTHAPAVD